MDRILVIRGGAIGDFVLTLPALKLLRDHFPSAHLEILGHKQIASVAVGRFYAHASRSIEDAALASFFTHEADLPEKECRYFSKFDLIISYLFDPRGTFERNVKRCGVGNFLAGPARMSGNRHAAHQLAQPLESLGLHLSDAAGKIYLSPADQNFAAAFLGTEAKPVIAFHPGSGSASKNWPLERWIALGEDLQASGEYRLLIVGGEADEDRLQSLRSVWPGKSVRLAEHLPLPQLAGLLERCAIFVGHDSGISHLAAAVETPCLLLFGPTDPSVWAPANRHVRIIRAPHGQLKTIEVKTVRAEFLARRQKQRARAPALPPTN